MFQENKNKLPLSLVAEDFTIPGMLKTMLEEGFELTSTPTNQTMVMGRYLMENGRIQLYRSRRPYPL